MNKVIMLGNITKDLELRFTKDEKCLCQFSIAINSGYGENKRTDFIECVVWNKQAENLVKYCGKGSQIGIEGRLQNSSYEDKEGNKRTKTQILCENITFVNTKKTNEEPKVETKEDPYKEFAEEIALDDNDLPF